MTLSTLSRVAGRRTEYIARPEKKFVLRPHLAQWSLQPIAGLMAEEVSRKPGSTVTMDVTRPLQAFDSGGRVRAAKQIVDMLATAKEAGMDPATALKLVDWAE